MGDRLTACLITCLLACLAGGLIDWMAGKFFKGKNTSSSTPLLASATHLQNSQFMSRSLVGWLAGWLE
jgi:membrane protein YqaA with SNARE-associated domain